MSNICTVARQCQQENPVFTSVPPWGLNPGPSWREANGWTTGPVGLCMNAVRLLALHRAPPSSPLCQLWSQKEDLHWAWNRDRRAVWNQVGLSHCRHDSLVTVWDEAHLRWGHNDLSCRGHQCIKTTPTGESWFQISNTLMTGSKQVDHWTSGTVYECSEIAGFPQYTQYKMNETI
jgi:hypothetical protein